MSVKRKITITVEVDNSAQALSGISYVAQELLTEARNHKGTRALIYQQIAEGLRQHPASGGTGTRLS